MKKFTLLAIAVLLSVVAFAQKPKQILRNAVPVELAQKNLQANVKGVARSAQSTARKAPRKAAGELVSLPAGATVEAWAVDQTNSLFAVYGQNGYSNATSSMKSLNVAIVDSEVYVQGLAYYFEDAWVKGALEGSTVTFPATTFVGEDEYGVEIIAGSADQGNTASDFTFTYDADAKSLTLDDGFLIFEADEDVSEGIISYAYWGSLVLTAGYEGPQVVELPADAVLEEYALSYVNSQGAAGSGAVNIAFVGNDVYMNGVSGYLPDAFIKGTLSGNTVTFPADQYLGNYLGLIDINFNPSQFGATDVVFTYDAAAGILTTSDVLYTVYYYNNGYYYDAYYGNAVIKKVVEAPATPANPVITAVANGSYGWTIRFNVPNVDTEGNGLVTSKLFYEFFIDVEHDVQPLTFTPATHSKLTEALTVIPFSFTDNYDFGSGLIYLNDLYSASWNQIGIKSIYEGGGEIHETEIQWYKIKNYAIDDALVALATEIAAAEALLADESNTQGIEDFTAAIEAAKALLENADATLADVNNAVVALKAAEDAFVEANKDPNAREAQWVAKEQGYENAEPVESFVIVEDAITATLDQAENANTAPAYYNTGSALRLYGANTLTISAAEGVASIDKIVFTTATSNSNNGRQLSADTGSISGASGTWTWSPADEATTSVTFTQGGTSGHVRITAITVSYTVKGEEEPIEEPSVVELANITPAPGLYDALPTEWVLTYGGKTLTVNEDADVKLTQGETEYPLYIMLDEEDATKAIIAFDGRAITTPGEWLVEIPENTITVDGVAIVEPQAFKYTVKSAEDYTIDPAEGEVESLKSFTLTFNNYAVELNEEEAAAFLFNTETEAEVEASYIGVVGTNKLYVELAEEVTEAGSYELIIADASVKNLAADRFVPELAFQYTIVAPAAPEVVVLPEGVEAEDYTFTASGYIYGNSGWQNSSREENAKVAIVGDDVYVSNLAYWFRENFAKGKLVGDKVVFKSGQFIGEDEYGPEYIVAVTVDEEGYFVPQDEFYFDFDAEARTLTLGDVLFAESGDAAGEEGFFTYYEQAQYTPGGIVLPDLVEVPEDAVVETWYLSGTAYSGRLGGKEVQVAVAGSDIYLQGLGGDYADGWIKGTVDGDKATFESGQYIGNYGDYTLYIVGYNAEAAEDEDYIVDIDFDYDAEAGTLTTDKYIVVSTKPTSLNYADYYYNVVISREQPEQPELVEAPEDLVTEAYLLTALDTYSGNNTSYEVQVGFYGDDEVYFHGLSYYVPEAWVKGTIDAEGVVTVPETYLGIYESWFGDYEMVSEATSFVYDAEADKFTAAEFYSYDLSDGYYWDELADVVLQKVFETAATPADPEVTGFGLVNSDGSYVTYPNVSLNIPATDVDGNALVQGLLSYVLYIVDADGVQQELTLTTDLYTKLTEDLTEIPYTFTDNWDIYEGGSRVYLNQDPEEIASWQKIGVQSIYRGQGVENRSNIGWFDIQEYIDLTTGITNINVDATKAVVFDLQGRRVMVPSKGLYIVNGQKTVVK